MRRTLEQIQPRLTELAVEIAVSKIQRPQSTINQSDPEVKSYYQAREITRDYISMLIFEVFQQLKKEADNGR